jgi:hypothetical protein
MRIPLREFVSDRTLFFTAGNLPTQLAYGISQEDVSDAFVVSLLRSDQVLLAASFFFESAATRYLLRQFPSVWRPNYGGGLFFINTTYPSVVEHGLRKIDKSPSNFAPYTDPETVRTRGLMLDQLGQVGVRDDVDISAAIAGAWIRSCMSADPGSIGLILQTHVPASQIVEATVFCVSLAERRQHDFIWPAIETEIRSHSLVSSAHIDLRRALADLYAEVMSITLGAIEASPTLSPVTKPITERGIGHLGRFNTVLRRVGINAREIKEEQALVRLLEVNELQLLRSLDDEVLKSALELQQKAVDLWAGIYLAEERLPDQPRLMDRDLRRALALAFDAIGVRPSTRLVDRLYAIERAYGGSFLRIFRDRVQEVLERRLQTRAAQGTANPRIIVQDVILFATADPNIGGPSTRMEADRELKSIEASLQVLGDRASVRIHPIFAVETHEIGPAVSRYHPRFFHFSGHGDAAGYIFMQAAEGGQKPVQIAAVLEALGAAPSPLECAIFHSCYSLSALRGLRSNLVRYLVLSSGEIGEIGAREFSSAFYLAIGAGLEVPLAFENARARLLQKKLDAGLLQLFERNGVGEKVIPVQNIGSQQSPYYRRRA